MRNLFLSLLLFVSFAATAQDDSDVMDAYHEYQAALERGDDRKAREFAGEAYDKAESTWGASRKETALLATNYADELAKIDKHRKAIPVYERCATIFLEFEDVDLPRSYCLLSAAHSYRSIGRNRKAVEAYWKVIAITEPLVSSNKEAAGFAGEAYLGLAIVFNTAGPTRTVPRATNGSGETSSRIRIGEADQPADSDAEALLKKAVDYLSFGYGDSDEALATAYLLLGSYSEERNEYEVAHSYYEKAYNIQKALRGQDDKFTRQLEGRLLLMKAFIHNAELEGQARKRDPSGPDCTVVVRGDLEVEACRKLRIPPYFPNSALYEGQQGFVLVQFDLTEAGIVESPRVMYSWPGGIFDTRTIKSVKKWRYYPPTDQYGNIVSVSDLETIVLFMIE